MRSGILTDLISEGVLLVEEEFATHSEEEGKTVTWYSGSRWPLPRVVQLKSPSFDVSSTITHSLAKFFAFFLPPDPRIERVYWAFEGSVLRIWTIIDHPDDVLEASIYEAQLRFMDKFPDLECDFSVIYRLGKPVEEVRPEEAHLVSR